MSGDTIGTLPNGYEYVLVHFYSSGEAKANIVRSRGDIYSTRFG